MKDLMRSGKTKYAMAAAGMTGDTGRQVRGTLAVVQTKLESRRARIGTSRQAETAKCNQ